MCLYQYIQVVGKCCKLYYLHCFQIAVWLEPAALAIPSKILLSVIETNPHVVYYRNYNAAELMVRIVKVGYIRDFAY